MDITASQKHDLCLYKEQNTKTTHVDILAYFSTKWSATVGPSTVSDILKEQAKWLAVTRDNSGVLRSQWRRHYTYGSPMLELTVCDMVIKKAKEFGDKLSVTDFCIHVFG